MTRLADRPTVEVSALIAAPASSVWELVTDINISSRFQDEFREATWLDEGPALGARFVGSNATSRFSWETTCTIVEYTPDERFSWAVNDVDDPVAVWTFVLTATDDGTELIYRRVVGTGPSGLTAAIEQYPDREEEIIAKRDEVHRQHMQSVVDGIKSMAEAP
jgi:uncharacterized protein YndB with AHSA1/START domain